MSIKISGKKYTMMYGPTVGDKVRLADTDLIVEVEKELSWWETTQMKMGRLFLIVIAVLVIITVIKQRLKL